MHPLYDIYHIISNQGYIILYLVNISQK